LSVNVQFPAKQSTSATSCEVDIVPEPSFARAIHQPKQGCALGCSGPAANHDNDAMMRFVLGEFKEVVAIASQKHTVIVMRELKYGFIWGISRQHFPQERHFMRKFFE
jgi:hypothetical protein